MKIYTYPSKTAEAKLRAIVKRDIGFRKKDVAAVSRILDTVRKNGDEAVLDYSRRFDAPEMTLSTMRVSDDEISTAGRAVDRSFVRALNRAINTETTRMTKMVPFLATTGNTTPFIGLFGTVWGIMNSFHSIGIRGSANLAVVAPGISEALIATAAGLAVAIPAVIAFNHFMHKIRIIESELQSFSADFLNIVERDILRVKRSDV